MRRGSQQRGVPLGVDAFDADVEADRAALVVRQEHLGRHRLAAERERREDGQQQEQPAHSVEW